MVYSLKLRLRNYDRKCTPFDALTGLNPKEGDRSIVLQKNGYGGVIVSGWRGPGFLSH